MHADAPAQVMPRYVPTVLITCSHLMHCIGLHVIDATVFIAVSNLLAAFNFGKVVENGVPITPVVGQSNGAIRSVLACGLRMFGPFLMV